VVLGSLGRFGWGAGDAVEAGHEATIRAHRPGVGPAGALAASHDAAEGWALAGPPAGPQWHLVSGAYRGVPWRDLPERYGPWETVYKRFVRWQTDGTWARIEASLRTQADAAGELDWDAQIDSSVIRAHQHAAGARKGGSQPTRPPASRRLAARGVG
jgi:transposase